MKDSAVQESKERPPGEVPAGAALSSQPWPLGREVTFYTHNNKLSSPEEPFCPDRSFETAF